MRLFSIFLILSSFLGVGTAKACSFAPWAFSGLDDYSVYDSYFLENLSDENTRIALVKTKKVKKQSPENYKRTFAEAGDPNTLYKMRMEVIEVIKGSFSDDETIIVPKMSDEDKDEFQKRLKRNADFNFWDGFQLSAQRSSWYGGSTSCGPSFDHVLENKQNYIIFQRGTRLIYAEPVFGPDDPFVQDIKNLIQENEESPLKIEAEIFFNNMEGYKIFDVTACPEGKGPAAERLKLYRYSHINREAFEIFDYVQGVVEETNDATKLKPQNFLMRKECRIGDRFLVIEKKYSKVQPSDFRIMDLPIHRYLKITDGKINVDDIPTNYEFTGEKVIPVEQVKAWIREGREAAGKLEK